MLAGDTVDDLEPSESEDKDPSPIKEADQVIQRLKEASELAQATIAVTQEQQQNFANKNRQPAYSFQPRDKVWLNLKNYSILRPLKKLD